jgi:hypothetical protein
MEFREFGKIPRLKREIVITEKIDGTNAQIHITVDGEMLVGSRTRYITPQADNHGFARWAEAHREELLTLGPGRHFGEWWGNGIQRGYGLRNGDKRFWLFNVGRWTGETLPACVGLVPVLYQGPFSSDVVDGVLSDLRINGSKAAPGFMKPEGIIVYHAAARSMFKVMLEKDEEPKSMRVPADAKEAAPNESH